MKTAFLRNYPKKSIRLFGLYTLYKKKCFNDILRITVILEEYDFPGKSTYNLGPGHLLIHKFLYYILAYFYTEYYTCISKM